MIVGVDADVVERVAERAADLVARGVSSFWPPPRVWAIAASTSGWARPSGMIPAPCRASAEKAWLPTVEASRCVSAADAGVCSAESGRWKLRRPGSCSSSNGIRLRSYVP